MNKFNRSDSKKRVEELAKIFASNTPKETSFNNIKTRKYFNKKGDTEKTTIKDFLMYKDDSSKNQSEEIQSKNL